MRRQMASEGSWVRDEAWCIVDDRAERAPLRAQNIPFRLISSASSLSTSNPRPSIPLSHLRRLLHLLQHRVPIIPGRERRRQQLVLLAKRDKVRARRRPRLPPIALRSEDGRGRAGSARNGEELGRGRWTLPACTPAEEEEKCSREQREEEEGADDAPGDRPGVIRGRGSDGRGSDGG